MENMCGYDGEKENLFFIWYAGICFGVRFCFLAVKTSKQFRERKRERAMTLGNRTRKLIFLLENFKVKELQLPPETTQSKF